MSKHTPGPWRWEFNEKHGKLTLVGGVPKYDLTIMEFCRWGMWGAGVSMRDTVPEADGFNLMYKVHERKDWVEAFPGRSHHKDWCAAVKHPDMVLMQEAPNLLAMLEEARRTLEMWKDVAPALSLCADIDKAIAKARGE